MWVLPASLSLMVAVGAFGPWSGPVETRGQNVLDQRPSNFPSPGSCTPAAVWGRAQDGQGLGLGSKSPLSLASPSLPPSPSRYEAPKQGV